MIIPSSTVLRYACPLVNLLSILSIHWHRTFSHIGSSRMPTQLLPASAAAFAPRSNVNIVLDSKVEPWLTQTLKRINRAKRPLNSVQQHMQCLTETLSGSDAIWSLCSFMVFKAPDAELRKDANPLVEAIFNYQVIHIEAYVVHVDMVLQHEMSFKLMPETIQALTEYHKDVYMVDVFPSTWQWPEKEAQLDKLQEEFVQAINRYVFRTGARALEGMEEEGAGELLEGRGEEVKNAIMGLFHPLLPSDVLRPAPLSGSSSCKTRSPHPSPTACSETSLLFWDSEGVPCELTSQYGSSSQGIVLTRVHPLPSILAQQHALSAVQNTCPPTPATWQVQYPQSSFIL